MKYQKILEHKQYQDYLGRLNQLEQNRIYCKHDLNHLLDVARICTILAQEQGITTNKNIVYAASLLHDIGRFNPDVSSHEKLSGEIARSILPECGYLDDEIGQVIDLIHSHRGRDSVERIRKMHLDKQLDLKDCFRLADQLSRNCFCCQAADTCKWKVEERNQVVLV